MAPNNAVARWCSSLARLGAVVSAASCSTGNSGPTASTDALATTSTTAESGAGPGGASTAAATTTASPSPAGATATTASSTPNSSAAPTLATTSGSAVDSVASGQVTDHGSESSEPASAVSLATVTGPALSDSAVVDEATHTGAGSSTVDENGDLIAPRALEVTATPGRHEHRFRARDADPSVSYNDNDQIALFDNRAPILAGKLVLTFGGAGETKGNLTGGGEFTAKRGFHVLAVAAFQAYNIVDYGPDFFGLARRTVFEGVMHTKLDAFANITLTPADGVAQRTQKALEYLHATYPDEDWGYYLQSDGSVRWSDVIFTGVSHGASNSARFASLVRASRVVAVAGPRDNLCARVDVNDCGGEVATWYDEEPQTPIDRYYTITGVTDDQHTQHLFAMEKLGYVGEPTRVDNVPPPYVNSHRLVHGGGHDDVCANQAFQDLCNYAFGVPAENHAGTQ